MRLPALLSTSSEDRKRCKIIAIFSKSLIHFTHMETKIAGRYGLFLAEAGARAGPSKALASSSASCQQKYRFASEKMDIDGRVRLATRKGTTPVSIVNSSG